MKLGVISDTHGDMISVYRAMQLVPDAAAWLHLGDVVSDAELLSEKSGADVYTVRGNCDTYAAECPYERVLTFEGVRILVTHGHRYHVDIDRAALSYRAEELGCRLALYGHTHVSMVENDGRVISLNPGSSSRPRGGRKPSIACVELCGADFSTKFILL